MTITITVPEEIESELTTLTPAEREGYITDALRQKWQGERDASHLPPTDWEAWDKQIEADFAAGRLDALLAEVDADTAAGRVYEAPPHPPYTPISQTKP